MKGRSREKIADVFEWIRCLADGEKFLPRAWQKPSSSDEFALKIERAIETRMREERFSYRNGKIIFPTKYCILISRSDEAQWRGVKRKVLESRLRSFMHERLQPVYSSHTYAFDDYEVSIKADDLLREGDLEVKHFWADTDETFEVRIRSISPDIDRKVLEATTQKMPNGLDEVTRIRRGEHEEETVVRQGRHDLHNLEVWRDGICQKIYPIGRNAIFIGRGSGDVAVDVSLHGDPEISRLHVILTRKEHSGIDIEVIGKNPVFVNEKILQSGQSLCVSGEEILKIGNYALRMKK